MADLRDTLGLVGAVLFLSCYGLGVAGRLDPKHPLALLLNFAGASLVLLSLTKDFNLSAALVEGAWALISAGGLVTYALRRPKHR